MNKLKKATSHDKDYCTMYVIRHGETDWNVKKIIQGHRNNVLNEKGKQQAKETANRFRNIKFDAIFSSDLLRAKQTAEIIAKKFNLGVKTNQNLRERGFGKFEGRPEEEFKKELKKLLIRFNQADDQTKFRFKFPSGVETIGSVNTRFTAFLKRTAFNYPGKTVLVITHGGSMTFLLVHLRIHSFKDFGWRLFDNTGYIKLISDGKKFIIKGIRKS